MTSGRSAIHDRYVGGEYLEKHSTWHVQDSVWKGDQVLAMLHRHGIAPRTVSEVGCGAGAILRHLHDNLDRDVTYVGYEISPQAYELCQSRTTERLRFELGNFHGDSEPCFDLILIMDLVEHVEDYFGLLKTVQRRGGHSIFHVPLDLSVRKAISASQFLESRSTDGHIHYFNKDTALATLEDAGFTVLDWFYTPTLDLWKTTNLRSRLSRAHRKALFRVNEDLAVRVWGGWSLLALAR